MINFLINNLVLHYTGKLRSVNCSSIQCCESILKLELFGDLGETGLINIFYDDKKKVKFDLFKILFFRKPYLK